MSLDHLLPTSVVINNREVDVNVFRRSAALSSKSLCPAALGAPSLLCAALRHHLIADSTSSRPSSLQYVCWGIFPTLAI